MRNKAGQVTDIVAAGSTRFASRPDRVSSAVSEVLSWLADGGMPRARLENVQIVLTEVINNVVEHAYAGGPPGEIGIECSLTSSALTVIVSDRGAGFSLGRPPPGLPADLSGPRTDLPEGGYGWHLIRTLSSSVSYRQRDGQNRLTLRFDLAG